MKSHPDSEVWFLAGSQDLYGPETLAHVEAQWREVADGLDRSTGIPVRIVARKLVTDSAGILQACQQANAAPQCIGVVVWMHTFSPAKMWIAGLSALHKPLLHLHTQFNERLPWSEIDMDFMNLNQAAHGDREFAHLATRLRLRRKTVVGHWRDPRVIARVASWCRAAIGWHAAQTLRVARFGDNMRDVAVTEGDKVEAQIRFGISVDGYGIGDLVDAMRAAPREDVEEIVAAYDRAYLLDPVLRDGGSRRESLIQAARIEAGLRGFLTAGGYGAFTDTFQDLHGLPQLPGLPVQRLMADGYGFGAEGDWKTAALLRVVKEMARGLPGGTSFIEDYTYDLTPGSERVLGSHMLEVCPTITDAQPTCEIHPLGIGDRDDPVRLVFDAASGPALLVSMFDLGDRFRMIVNEVDVLPVEEQLPRLPVARALWNPLPDFFSATEAWLTAGGPHHSVLTSAVDADVVADLASMFGVELLRIDKGSTLPGLLNELRWNDEFYARTSR
jgi:L-arabinose isomerase